MKTIQFDFKPSVLLSALITAVSTGAAGILILLGFSWQIKLLLLLLVISAAAYAVCCYALLLLDWSCIGLEINTQHQLKLRLRNGLQLQVKVLESSVVTPYLTVLNCKLVPYDQLDSMHWMGRCLFKLRRMQISIVIFPDSLDQEKYRQLRVWLRWASPRQLQGH